MGVVLSEMGRVNPSPSPSLCNRPAWGHFCIYCDRMGEMMGKKRVNNGVRDE